MSRLPKDTWSIDLSPLTKLHVCVETQKEKRKQKKGVCECKMDGRVKKKQREAAWKNLINADNVSWWSPPTRVRRKDSCFSPDSHRLVNRIVLLQLQPCWRWIWTWQQTRGTLLAALSFNNRYPSPSVSSVSWVCSCLFWPSFLLYVYLSSFFFFLMLFLFPAMCFQPLHLGSRSFSTPVTLLFIFPCNPPFIPLFNLFLFPSPSHSFHLSIATSAGTNCSKRFYKAEYLLPER